MKFKFTLAALLIAPLAFTACSKQEKASASEQTSSSEAASAESANTSAEQQAVIDALDQPVLDEKNTDVPAEKANAPADAATPATEEEAPKAQ
ncbi:MULTISPECIES: hypothetical protein [Acinetobacter]|uniref:hypothetical protein n=1 Tax=Acinetobacter TaxID=469 RepID=UPI000CFF7678|nr:hypothetical protein [Acinetobacter sp. MYb10]QLD60387.1 hypothetical protein CQZ96_003545 [Acinetobacter sp. MYb10]